MPGTKAGAKKIVATLTARDPDHFAKIGSKGGRVSNPNKGFGANRELASRAGKMGGPHLGKQKGK